MYSMGVEGRNRVGGPRDRQAEARHVPDWGDKHVFTCRQTEVGRKQSESLQVLARRYQFLPLRTSWYVTVYEDKYGNQKTYISKRAESIKSHEEHPGCARPYKLRFARAQRCITYGPETWSHVDYLWHSQMDTWEERTANETTAIPTTTFYSSDRRRAAALVTFTPRTLALQPKFVFRSTETRATARTSPG